MNGTHARRRAFYSLPQEHWTLLSKPPFSILESFNRLDDLIDNNADLAEAIFKAGFKAFLAPTIDSDWVASIVPEKYARDEYQIYSIVMDHLEVSAAPNDLEKARGCVNQFYREWSAEGTNEREKCFKPVLEALEAEFQRVSKIQPEIDRGNLRVLVPGAGLGRLVFDVCRLGFSVEGNEISYHELMASSLILNHTERIGQYSIAPFALNPSNHISRADQFQTVLVPDIHPGTELINATSSSIPAYERMSMSTGDFCVLYSQHDSQASFDAVTTVFFIDTAPNVIRYIEAVRNCLKPGGIWINLGPLLWHHSSRKDDKKEASGDPTQRQMEVGDAGIGDPGAVELTHEEVVALVKHFGFTVDTEEVGQCETGYVSNSKSLLQNTYRPTFWIARKSGQQK